MRYQKPGRTVIRPDMAGAKMFVDSFRSEGIALAKLRHPGIVPIYDIREGEGLIYYVMPLVDGETIGSKLERLRRLPPSETHRILLDLCDALAAAHREKMVHRDLKPDNVILEGTQQKALLMDFGIAKSLTEEVQDSSGEPIIGTPRYMSPEQVAGKDEIDHRSDIYSLGVMAYHMLIGKPPFDGTQAEILKKHANEKPTPIRDLNPSVPKDMADAIMRCLEKDPWDRFSTTGDLWTALKSVSFVRPPTDKPRASSSGTSTDKVVLLALLCLIAGFVVGRAVVGGGRVLPPSDVEAGAFVADWLDNGVGDVSSVFETGATVMIWPSVHKRLERWR